jgi:hypothetical protein
MFCKAFDQAPSTPPIEVSVRLVVAAPVSIGCRTRIEWFDPCPTSHERMPFEPALLSNLLLF